MEYSMKRAETWVSLDSFPPPLPFLARRLKFQGSLYGFAEWKASKKIKQRGR